MRLLTALIAQMPLDIQRQTIGGLGAAGPISFQRLYHDPIQILGVKKSSAGQQFIQSRTPRA
jgi:hypothetical protein